VIDFCNKVHPKLFADPSKDKFVAFELEDPVGPTGTDPDLEALILTREVEKGGAMVNEARAKQGLRSLKLVFVDMILAVVSEEDRCHQYSNKTSSTFIREYLSKLNSC
jgi:pantetheine-phosphate adenylyltransferase